MIIRRYLVREILQAFTSVLAVLLLVYLANRLVRFLTEAVAGRIPADVIFQLMSLKLGANVAVLLPLALFVGVLIALGRLYRDSEIVAMAVGGIGIVRIAVAVTALSAAFGLLTGAFSLFIGPEMVRMQERLVTRAKSEAEVTGVIPGQFKHFGAGNVVYVASVDDDGVTMRDVFVRILRDRSEDVLVSRRAFHHQEGSDGDRFIMLEDGYRYAGVPGEVDYVVTRFARHAVRMDAISEVHERRTLQGMSSFALWTSEDRRRQAELQWRISLPLQAVILGALAVPLARTSPRQGRYSKLFVGIVIYFIYSNCTGIAQNLVERGKLPALIGVWPVHLVVAAVVVLLIASHSYGLRNLARRLGRGRRAA